MPKILLTLAALGALVGCGAATAPLAPVAPLTADAPSTTALGNTFVAPAGWTLSRQGAAVVLRPPEGGSAMVMVDVADAADGNAAVAAAWATYLPGMNRPLRVVTPVAPRDGWSNRSSYSYQTSPNERRDVEADVRRANGVWTVTLYDMAQAVGEKRAAQVNQIYGKLLPKGYKRESFAGRAARPLDAGRLAELGRFVQAGMAATGVPGVSLGLIQGGRVVHAGGFGVRAQGQPEPVDADTRFMVASNTKALATLMLARLVEAGRMGWDTPAVQLLPSFRLGDETTTRQVRVKHLICACTGMPRQDLEWLLEFEGMTAEGAMRTLATMKPTSGFGELYQYSNPMAAAAGYIGGHVAHPTLELGAAYDLVMQEQVFGPLGMSRTTHDMALARRGNTAVPHAPDADGRMTRAVDRANDSIVPVRPAGGAWSNVNDVLKYVAMELAEGRLGDGSRYVGRDTLLARRAPQVQVGPDITYGMGLMVNRVYGIPVVHHGGDMIGFHSDMIWLPEHGVGAVILTNGDPGWILRSAFRRKLLEVLFDGRPEADATVQAQSTAYFADIAAERRLISVPAEPAVAAMLAARYAHPALGSVTVASAAGKLSFDFGEYASEMASRRNPDGTVSLVTIVPGMSGLEFVVGARDGRRTLVLRDAQHEYVLTELP